MTNSRTTKRIICGLTALAFLSLPSLDASAGMSVMAASGRPYNNTPQSSFSITDGRVSFDLACSVTWILPIPVPYSTSAKSYTVTGKKNSPLVYMDACTFNPGGGWTGCSSLNNGAASVSVPASGGTLFVRAYNSGCTSGGNFFYGAYISN